MFRYVFPAPLLLLKGSFSVVGYPLIVHCNSTSQVYLSLFATLLVSSPNESEV